MRISSQILALWHAYHIQLQTLTESCNLICTVYTLYNTDMIFIFNTAHASITSPLGEKLGKGMSYLPQKDHSWSKF